MADSLRSRVLWVLGVGAGAFVVLAAAASVADNGKTLFAAGLVVGALLLYWTMKERQETDSTAETAENVGEKASDLFGGVVDWVSAIVLAILFVAVSAGTQLLDVLDVGFQFIGSVPIVSTLFGAGGAIWAIDAFGPINLSSAEWGAVVAALIVIAVFARRALYGEVDS